MINGAFEISGHLGGRVHWPLGALSGLLLYSEIIWLNAELMQICWKVSWLVFQICKTFMFISFHPKSIFHLLREEGNEVEGEGRCALAGASRDKITSLGSFPILLWWRKAVALLQNCERTGTKTQLSFFSSFNLSLRRWVWLPEYSFRQLT